MADMDSIRHDMNMLNMGVKRANMYVNNSGPMTLLAMELRLIYKRSTKMYLEVSSTKENHG